jgi:hypothetical protein
MLWPLAEKKKLKIESTRAQSVNFQYRSALRPLGGD